MRIGLLLSHGGRVVLWRPIEQGPLVVGRNPECDLSVPDDGVGSIQCVIHRAGDSLTLENRNHEGTRVGGEPVMTELRLADADEILLGPMVARVRFITLEHAERGRTRTLAEQGRAATGELFVSAPEAHPGRRWSLGEGEVGIGSDPGNDVVLDDPFVSSFHARFLLDGGRVIIRDLDSRNGVFVREQKIREGEVPPGAQVRVGKSLLVVGAAHDAAAPEEGGAARQLIGASAALTRVRELVRRVAATDAAVLISGETGTGKEVVARLLAELSPRAGRPFVALNCGSLSRNLIESELFGHERGAFTGAVARKAGAFEAAHGGTLFLDELGELPLELQPQLLRVLESGDVRRVGATQTLQVDVRVIAATNRRLEREVGAGTFRADLFHRLHVLTVDLPPLRERVEDVPELARHFAAMFAPDGEPVQLAAAALEALQRHDWPGNVRELRNVIQRAVLLRQGPRVEAADITFTPSTLTSRVQTAAAVSGRTLHEIEREAIVTELARHNGNKKEAAAALGVSRSTIHRKIEEFGIEVGELVRA